jgi:hypothetical protein
MRDWLKENAEGFSGAATRIWRTVTLDKGSLVDDLDKALRKSWKGPDAPPAFAVAHEEVLEKSIRQGVLKVKGFLDPPGSDGTADGGARQLTAEPEGPLDDLSELVAGLELVRGDQPLDAVDALPPDPRSIALIPVLALEMMRLAEVQFSEGKALRKLDEEDWVSAINQMTEQRRLLLTALVAFIGGDALGGQLDTVGGLAMVLQSVFGSGSAATGLAATAAPVSAAATVAAGAVLVAVSAAIILKYMNEQNLKRREQAGIAIRAVGDTHKADLLGSYDASIARLRQILEARLRIMYHVDDLKHRRWVLEKLVEDFTVVRLELLERISADAAAVG